MSPSLIFRLVYLLLLGTQGEVFDMLEVLRGSTLHGVVEDKREMGRWEVTGSKSCLVVKVCVKRT